MVKDPTDKEVLDPNEVVLVTMYCSDWDAVPETDVAPMKIAKGNPSEAKKNS